MTAMLPDHKFDQRLREVPDNPLEHAGGVQLLDRYVCKTDAADVTLDWGFVP
jgi:hypothetical protein